MVDVSLTPNRKETYNTPKKMFEEIINKQYSNKI